MNTVLGAILAAHIAGGSVAILAGAAAVIARKGSRIHKLAGTWFFGSMLLLGVSASVLEPFRTPEPGSPLIGVLVCYFVLTSWVTARRRDGTTGRFEVAACIVALGMAAAILWNGMSGASTTPVGQGPVFVLAGLSLLAGLGDINVILRKKMTASQRLSRHLWRMCFAFFVATGSFFIGQQDVMPAVVRGSPFLFVLGFAPLGIMLFWLVRIRLAKPLRRITESLRLPVAPQQG